MLNTIKSVFVVDLDQLVSHFFHVHSKLCLIALVTLNSRTFDKFTVTLYSMVTIKIQYRVKE